MHKGVRLKWGWSATETVYGVVDIEIKRCINVEEVGIVKYYTTRYLKFCNSSYKKQHKLPGVIFQGKMLMLLFIIEVFVGKVFFKVLYWFGLVIEFYMESLYIIEVGPT
jgi:hypothetical protein